MSTALEQRLEEFKRIRSHDEKFTEIFAVQGELALAISEVKGSTFDNSRAIAELSAKIDRYTSIADKDRLFRGSIERKLDKLIEAVKRNGTNGHG